MQKNIYHHLLLLVPSCDKSLDIEVKKLGHEVVFYFGDARFISSDYDSVCLLSLTVNNDRTDSVVWRMRRTDNSCTMMNSVTLGKNYDHYQVTDDKLPLGTTEKYRVTVFADEGVGDAVF